MKSKNRLTMKDLATELGLSVTVVSRVLSGNAAKSRISENTRRAVMSAAKKHEFTPNQLARGLRLQKSQTIGLLIPDISNIFFSDVARSVESSARRRGYSIILCDTEESEVIEKTSLEILLARKVDGLIVAPVGETSECSHLLELLRDDIPVVLLDRFLPSVELPYVTSDNRGGGYAGTKYLLDSGHRAIGFVQGIPNAQTNLERLAGYRAALAERKVRFKASFVVGQDFGEQNGYNSTRALLALSPRPTAIFVTSSVGALGAMRACADAGVQIPDDISLIGFDEYPYAALLAPPLTTIAQQTLAIGRAAADLLLDWLDTGAVREKKGVILDTALVPRDSVRVIAPS